MFGVSIYNNNCAQMSCFIGVYSVLSIYLSHTTYSAKIHSNLNWKKVYVFNQYNQTLIANDGLSKSVIYIFLRNLCVEPYHFPSLEYPKRTRLITVNNTSRFP